MGKKQIPPESVVYIAIQELEIEHERVTRAIIALRSVLSAKQTAAAPNTSEDHVMPHMQTRVRRCPQLPKASNVRCIEVFGRKD